MTLRNLCSMFFAALITWTLLPLATLAQDGAAAPRSATIEVDLLAALAKGPASFFVDMEPKADLSHAYEIDDWDARGWYVYNVLKSVAARTQAPVIEYARKQGLQYRSFFGGNMVYIESGDLEHALALTGAPGVARLFLAGEQHIAPGEASLAEAGYSAVEPTDGPESYGWNLDVLDPASGLYGMQAAQVWAAYGIKGDGIIVANIDTGVTYTHPALVHQYRGYLGAGAFDHDFNWYQPTVAGCGDGTYPCDHNRHGSGTMGIMVGETEDLIEQIGVAPQAKWIACMGCTSTGCADYDLTSCADWMLAPCPIGAVPGDPSCDPSLRPHVVNNSWGGSGCDTWYQTYVQAWVASGQFPAFSTGGTASCGALDSPGDYPEAFGTAAHREWGIPLYAGGPSCFYPAPTCDPEAHDIDPHVSAPTYGRTADNGTGYYNLSGSSGSIPHAAGAVALLWSAFPYYIGDVYDTYTILEQSANKNVPVGYCGKPACAGSNTWPNYSYGWGYLDVYEALSPCCHPPGWLDGTVTEADTGIPLPEVTVTADLVGGGDWSTLTGATGYYTMPLPSGVYNLTAEGPLHAAAQVSGVVVVSSTITTVDFQLEPKGLLYGYITDVESGTPLDAAVTISPGAATVPSDPTTGYYQAYLASGPYTLTAHATGYTSDTASVNLTSGLSTRQDFQLLADVAVVPEPIAITLQLGTTGSVTSVMTNHMSVDYPFEFSLLASSRSGSQVEDLLVVRRDETAAASMEAALTALGYTFHGVPDAAFQALTAPELLQYQAVFYAGPSQGDTGPPGASEVLLMAFLDAGGSLYISDNDLGYYRYGSVFYDTYLQSSYASDNGGEILIGEDLMAGITLDITPDPYPDAFTLGAQATRIFQFPGGQAGGVAVNRVSTPSRAGYRAIYTSFDFHYIVDPAHEVSVVDRVMRYLTDGGAWTWFVPGMTTGTVPAGDSVSWTNAFHATATAGILQPGLYEATLRILPAASSLPRKYVGVVMEVTPPPTYGLLEGTITSGRTGEPVEAAIVIESSSGTTLTLTTEPGTGQYSHWLEAATYTATVHAAGYIDDQAVVGIVAGMTTTQNFALEFDAPWITFQPDAYEPALLWGLTATQPFTISNLGPQPLTWEIAEVDTGLAPCIEHYGGDLGDDWYGGSHDRGNFFEATEDTIIAEIRTYLAFSSATDMYFVVYESDTLLGTYNQIHAVHVPEVGPGQRWWSSGPVDVPVQAGKFYYISGSWNADATYYTASTNNTPYATGCLGTLHTGSESGSGAGYPPAPSFINNSGSGSHADLGVGVVTVGGDPLWLSETPVSGTVPPYTTFAGGQIHFDAGAVAAPGTYTASLRVRSDDPLEPLVNVPVTMTVLPCCDLGLITGTVTSAGYCDAQRDPLESELVAHATGGLTYTTTSNPVTGEYHFWLEPGTYTVTATAAGHLVLTDVVEVHSTTPITLDLSLRYVESCMAVAPEAFALTLPVDALYTGTLAILNSGAGELMWQVQETATNSLLDVPWVSEVPTSGVTLPDHTFDVHVVFDTHDLSAGECYTASLSIHHDDPGFPVPFLVPLELCIPVDQPVLTLTKCVQPLVAHANEVVTFTLTAANTGGVSATVDIDDLLPGGLRYIASNPAGTYDPLTPTVSWNGLVLDAGTQMILTVEVSLTAGITPNTWVTNLAHLQWQGDVIEAAASFYVQPGPGVQFYYYLPVTLKGYDP